MRFWKFWFPVLVYSGIIFYASSIPSVDSHVNLGGFDKGLHIIEYMPFGWLLARALRATCSRLSLTVIVMLTAVICAFYGLSDEFHQRFVEGRNSDFWDLAADFTGGIIGGWIYIFSIKGKS